MEQDYKKLPNSEGAIWPKIQIFRGIYLLYKADKIVYVGQSTLSTVGRAGMHCVRFEFDYIHIIPIASEDMNTVEAYLIHKLNPAHNGWASTTRKNAPGVDLTKGLDVLLGYGFQTNMKELTALNRWPPASVYMPTRPPPEPIVPTTTQVITKLPAPILHGAQRIHSIKLTKGIIERLRAPDPSRMPIIHWDAELKGFGVLCSGVARTKKFIIQGEVNGRHRRITLGTVIEFEVAGKSVDDVRTLAAEQLLNLRQGKDPRARNGHLAR